MINKSLRNALLKKPGMSPASLSRRASAIRQRLAMTKDESYYLVAHEKGLSLDKYVSGQELNRIMELQNRWASLNRDVGSEGGKRPKPGDTRRAVVSIRLDNRVIDDVPFVSRSVSEDAKRMASVFALLYVLENSLRSFLVSAMEKWYGPDWWEKACKSLHAKVSERKKKEAQHPYVQKRASSNIYYLDLNELVNLATKVDEKLVELGVLPRRDWLKNLIDDLYLLRCVICHMNPLKPVSVKHIEVALDQWCSQARARRDLLLDTP